MTGLRYPLFLLACGGFVSGVSMRLAEPLLPRVAHDLGTGVAEASVLITAFTLAYGLFQLVHGPLGDRIGKLRAVSGALCLAALASAACASANTLSELALYRFLTGMTAGAVIPLSFAFVGDNVPFEDRQPVLGRFISGTLLGATFGPLVGGALSDLMGWRASFIAPAAAFLLIGVALAPLGLREAMPRAAGPGRGPLARYAGLLRSPSARIICLAVALEGFLFYGAFGYLGAFLRHDFQLSYTQIGLVLAGFGLGGLAYSLLVGTLVRRLGARRMVIGGAWLLLGAFGVLAVTPWWQGVVPAVMLLGLAFYLLHNTLQTRATEMAPAARGSAISAFAFCLFFGQALGVAGGGPLVEVGGYRLLFALAGIGLAGLALWFAARLRDL
jgi:predicted MFS family arabinose efflux permease